MVVTELLAHKIITQLQRHVFVMKISFCSLCRNTPGIVHLVLSSLGADVFTYCDI